MKKQKINRCRNCNDEDIVHELEFGKIGERRRESATEEIHIHFPL